MLTPAQQATLKAHVNNSSDLNTFANNSDGNFAIAALLNLAASPAFYVWRTSVEVTEIMQNGFDWTRVDNLTVGKARIFDWMMQTGTLRPHQSNVRAGVLACFSVAADLATRQAIFGHCQRTASRVEKLLATGAGTSSTDQGVGPALMGFEGPIDFNDVEQARNS